MENGGTRFARVVSPSRVPMLSSFPQDGHNGDGTNFYLFRCLYIRSCPIIFRKNMSILDVVQSTAPTNDTSSFISLICHRPTQPTTNFTDDQFCRRSILLFVRNVLSSNRCMLFASLDHNRKSIRKSQELTSNIENEK